MESLVESKKPGVALTETFDGERRRRNPFEGVTDSEIETMLLQKRPDNYGNNGIIYTVDLDAPDVNTGNPELPNPAALKLLKIYSAGMGRQEYETQRRVYELMASRDRSEDVAKIPEPWEIRDITIRPETREKLNHDGAALSLGKAEVVIMDFVPGKDLATIIYENILKLKGVEGYMGGFNGLHRRVSEVMGFEDPADVMDEVGRTMQARQLFMKQSSSVYELLRKNNFFIHPRIVNKIKNTLDVMHGAGIRHGDLHERNIIITGDPMSEDAEVFLIDFGSSYSGAPEDDRMDDYDLVRRLQLLLVSKNEEIQKERVTAIEELGIFFEKYLKSEAGISQFNSFSSRIITEQVLNSMPSEINLKKLLAVVYKMILEKRVSLAETIQVLQNFVENQSPGRQWARRTALYAVDFLNQRFGEKDAGNVS